MRSSRHPDATGFTKKAKVPWYENPMALALAAPVAGAVVNAGAYGIQKLMASRDKANAYKGMLAGNRHLRHVPAKDTQRYFNTLWTLNPTLAKDPTTAGAFVFDQSSRSDAAFPHRGILEGAQAMSGINKNIMDARSRRRGYDYGGTAQNILNAYRSGIQEKHTGTLADIKKERAAQEETAKGFAAEKKKLEAARKKSVELAHDLLQRERRTVALGAHVQDLHKHLNAREAELNARERGMRGRGRRRR